eukprot:gene21666-27556_t
MMKLRQDTKELCDNDEKLSSELQFIKNQLIGVLKNQSFDEETYKRESRLLLQGLRNVQIQLSSIDNKFGQLFIGLNKSMKGIRNSLRDNLSTLSNLRNDLGKQISQLEINLKSSNQEGIDKALNELTLYIEDIAIDLQDSVRESVINEFAIIKHKLKESEQSQGLVLSDLRGIQAQLAE